VHIIDQDQIHWRMVDLDHGQRPVGTGKRPWNRRILIPHAFAALAAAKRLLVTQRLNAVAHGVGVGTLNTRVAAATGHFMTRLLHRAFLAVEIKLVDGGDKEGLHLGIKARVAPWHAGFGRRQGRELATLSIVLQPAVERRGVASRSLGSGLHLLTGTVWIIQ
jgi:hypothetical protein